MKSRRIVSIALTWPVVACGPKAPAQGPEVTAQVELNTANSSPPAAAAAPSVEAPGSPIAPDAIAISVTNPLPVAREHETVSVSAAQVGAVFPYFDLDKTTVVDAAGNPLLSQLIDIDGVEGPEELIFQVDLGPSETKGFKLRPSAREIPAREQFKVYGRFVRERHDDFAWENDRIAHRMYGPELETAAKEPLVSSGIDAWSKRAERLLINEWYQTDNYHDDHGDGADFYSVGKSRGCGGLGAWQNGKLFTSKNFTTSRVLANGPLRLVFELDYAAWSTGGSRVSETKRITLDASSSFNHFESRFKGGTFAAGLGISKHPGSQVHVDATGTRMHTWEPLKSGEAGNLGCAIVLPEGQGAAQQTESDYLLVTEVPKSGVLSYYSGFVWDKAGRVVDEPSWGKAVEGLQARLKAPVQVRLEVLPTARTWALLGADSMATNGAQVDANGAVHINSTELVALASVAAASKAPVYVDHLKRMAAASIQADGMLLGANAPDLSAFALGRALLTLRRTNAGVVDDQRALPAIGAVRARLQTMARTKEGLIGRGSAQPVQVWLDDAATLLPFMAEYAAAYGEVALYDDIAKQVAQIDQRLHSNSGLLVRAWDSAKQQKWANPNTGAATIVWSKALGAYASALADVIELLPATHPQRAAVVASFTRLASAIVKAQDPASGLWWQVTDAPKRDKNYLEAAGSSEFVFALGKAARNGWIDAVKFHAPIDRGFRGAVDVFAALDKQGRLEVKQGSPNIDVAPVLTPDASYVAYVVPSQSNDPDAIAAFTRAAIEAVAMPR